MIKNYVEFINYVKEQELSKQKIIAAVKKVIDENDDALKAVDKFNEAISAISGISFNLKNYGIRKISTVVKRHNEDKDEIKRNITFNVKSVFEDIYSKKAEELKVIRVVRTIVIDSVNHYYEKYHEDDFEYVESLANSCETMGEFLTIVFNLEHIRTMEKNIEIMVGCLLGMDEKLDEINELIKKNGDSAFDDSAE